MWEYEIKDKITGELCIIFGSSYNDALKRAGLNKENYDLYGYEFVD
jgi:hypothetical protein